MGYRNKTYIAADWDSDVNAVEILHHWNDSRHWSLTFHDVHEMKQAKDTSLCCSIKKSLRERMDESKRFVLIVGNNTTSVRKGSCQYCPSYCSSLRYCTRNRSTDFRSYVEYECEMALRDNISIVVLYKSARVDKSKCPPLLRNIGTHAPMCYRGDDGQLYWNYASVRKAFG